MINIDTTEKKYLRPDEFCALFDMKRTTFYRWVADGRIRERPRLHGQQIRIPIEEARRFRDKGPNDILE
jgi:excisionase family DNA binding protein